MINRPLSKVPVWNCTFSCEIRQMKCSLLEYRVAYLLLPPASREVFLQTQLERKARKGRYHLHDHHLPDQETLIKRLPQRRYSSRENAPRSTKTRRIWPGPVMRKCSGRDPSSKGPDVEKACRREKTVLLSSGLALKYCIKTWRHGRRTWTSSRKTNFRQEKETVLV